MLTDRQVKRLYDYFELGMTLREAALKSGMDEKTARKYCREWKLPSQLKKDRHWKTRRDPFEDVWDKIEEKLQLAPDLEAKTLFEWLQDEYPGRFFEGQLRTLQRRIKRWRALEGPSKEVFFPQVHHAGRLCATDFTRMMSLAVTIQGQPFSHLFFHFVLTYSNWETVTLCYSESWESFSTGLQNALWELGGVPERNRTDRLSAAVHKEANPEVFTAAYRGLLTHYGLEAERIQANKANENGDVEQSHWRFKSAVEQALLLRGSRDFESIGQYLQFITQLLKRRNAARVERFTEEQRLLRPLPATRLDDCKRIKVRVSRGSTARVLNNTYSVHSRLIGELVEARVYADCIEIWYAQRCVEKLPRLRGRGKHHIDYRHVIDWLVRKPGAFENYRYQADLFPTSYFRIAYDTLKASSPASANKEYLRILELAAKESEAVVNQCLTELVRQELSIRLETVKERLAEPTQRPALHVEVSPANLLDYDALLEYRDYTYEEQPEDYAR